MPKTKVTISLDEKIWFDFRNTCFGARVTASAIIERLIKDEKLVKEALKKEKQ